MRTKMTVKTKMNNVDKKDPMASKNKPAPKPTTFKISDSAASKSAAKYKPTASASLKAASEIKKNIGKINPVTGRPMTKADAEKMYLYNEKKKRS